MNPDDIKFPEGMPDDLRGMMLQAMKAQGLIEPTREERIVHYNRDAEIALLGCTEALHVEMVPHVKGLIRALVATFAMGEEAERVYLAVVSNHMLHHDRLKWITDRRLLADLITLIGAAYEAGKNPAILDRKPRGHDLDGLS